MHRTTRITGAAHTPAASLPRPSSACIAKYCGYFVGNAIACIWLGGKTNLHEARAWVSDEQIDQARDDAKCLKTQQNVALRGTWQALSPIFASKRQRYAISALVWYSTSHNESLRNRGRYLSIAVRCIEGAILEARR
jgi:hypothetical protein